jgi:hypothetical protein
LRAQFLNCSEHGKQTTILTIKPKEKYRNRKPIKDKYYHTNNHRREGQKTM